MIIDLVWDTSGSMAEWGKAFITRSVARSIEQYLRLGYSSAEMRLVAWGNDAHVLDWRTDHEFPLELLAPKGTANAKALTSLLGTVSDRKIILLTDGFWSRADSKELTRWMKSLQQGTLRIIKIGSDSNPHLKDKDKDVFAAEDLFTALNNWLNWGTT